MQETQTQTIRDALQVLEAFRALSTLTETPALRDGASSALEALRTDALERVQRTTRDLSAERAAFETTGPDRETILSISDEALRRARDAFEALQDAARAYDEDTVEFIAERLEDARDGLEGALDHVSDALSLSEDDEESDPGALEGFAHWLGRRLFTAEVLGATSPGLYSEARAALGECAEAWGKVRETLSELRTAVSATIAGDALRALEHGSTL